MANQTAPASGITVNTFGSSTYATAVKREIVRRLEQEAQYSTYFDRFTGEIDKFNRVPDAVVVRKSELRNGGDSMIIPMKKNISLNNRYGDAELIGTEATQELYNLEVKVNQWRAAVAGPDANANHRIKYLNMIQEMRPDLVRAVSREMDAEHFRCLCEGGSLNLTGSTTTGGLGIATTFHHKIYGVGESSSIDNNATTLASWIMPTTGTICSDNILDLDAIDALKALGKKEKIVPLDLGGDWWVLLCHQNQIYTIQTANSNAWRAGVEEAAQRGRDNPFFSGAVWAYNGIILHEHPDVPSVVSTGTGDVTYNYGDNNTNNHKVAWLLGRNCMAMAEGSPMKFTPEDYDYMNKRSIGMAQIFGLGRADYVKDDGNNATFISQSSLQVISYAADPTL